MPWDIPATLTEFFGIVRDIFKVTSADEQFKRLQNEKAKDEYEEEKDRESFAARMRRYLGGLKMLGFLFMFTLCASCGHQPLTPDERVSFNECKIQNARMREYLQGCLDHLDKAKPCDSVVWFESGCP